MKLFVECSTSSDINFQSSLFKMKTGQLDFRRFEDLFEKQYENAPGESSFNNEWRRCEKQFLHTEQPGVFIVVADVLEFIGGLNQILNFFVSYEVRSSILAAKLMLYLGEVDIDFQTFCVDKAKTLKKRSEVYRDLLAVTSTLTMVSIIVKLEIPLKSKLQDFLISAMKFEQLSNNIDDFETTTNTDLMEIDVSRCGQMKDTNHSFFFYCDKNYFNGTLIKLRVYDHLTTTLMVYFRSNHQIVTFAKAIYGQYSERCSINVLKSNHDCNLIAKQTQSNSVGQ